MFSDFRTDGCCFQLGKGARAAFEETQRGSIEKNTSSQRSEGKHSLTEVRRHFEASEASNGISWQRRDHVRGSVARSHLLVTLLLSTPKAAFDSFTTLVSYDKNRVTMAMFSATMVADCTYIEPATCDCSRSSIDSPPNLTNTLLLQPTRAL